MGVTAKPIFVQGAIPATMVAQCVQQYAAETTVGAYSCFIGQVRADVVGGKSVTAIEYTAYTAMVDEHLEAIAVDVCQRYALNGIVVKHSLGTVLAGEICLFVLAAAGHRRPAMDACGELVERIKSELPIWGKEHFAGEEYQWKTNQ
ncbi:molybdopterin synthase catalytic subunit [Parapedobacter luteus]|uniref:Molybdopterin synthase catalytic subunit n=1 Tax=Parapedobacter luteus TaxID=623280 RepID=A0A1T5B1L9_9SPHI|nr:molybdenum cofactor biosynthesis protein MoaE [Parapedobacter luteus]SKB40957.1 molybdopterin synthase catalytic subunit [Parapedobacter luteus]